MIKLLLGGSPCTYWSIAQKNNRETEPSGLGWELFKNYLIAKEKFKPDFFLYENNKSADEAIKKQIRAELEVWDGTFLMEDTGARYIEINSALVSAQNRQRFYVHNCRNNTAFMALTGKARHYAARAAVWEQKRDCMRFQRR